jgi:nucleoside-diphosphate-sugar epimerase
MVAPFVVGRLVASGRQAVAHGRTPLEGISSRPGVEWRAGDASRLASDAIPPDAAVVSLLPLWLTADVAQRLDPSIELVALGSTSALYKGESDDVAERALARRLADAEAALAARGAGYTLLRTTMIYCEGRDANVSALARFARRWRFVPLAGAANGLRQPIHADDVAAACVGALDNPEARGRAFELAGGETLTYRAMVERIVAALDRPARTITLPAGLLATLLRGANLLRGGTYSPALFARMNRDLVFDDSAARAVLGHQPRPFRPDFRGRL